MLIYFFFNDPATTEIYTLSLHDALPISRAARRGAVPPGLPPGHGGDPEPAAAPDDPPRHRPDSDRSAGEDARMRGRRKLRTGVVMSDKMQKTVTVSLVRRFAHGFYGKQVVRPKKVAAHDELGAKAGDTVRIMETRPVSKTKRWRVVAIVERAR